MFCPDFALSPNSEIFQCTSEDFDKISSFGLYLDRLILVRLSKLTQINNGHDLPRSEHVQNWTELQLVAKLFFFVLQRHLPACYGTLYFDLHYQLWNEIWNEMYWVFECIDDRFNSCRRFTLPWLSIFDWFLLFIRLTWLSMFSNKQAVLVTVED